MVRSTQLLRKINIASKTSPASVIAEAMESGGSMDDLMTNPHYLRQSHILVTDALKKGYDVLQLENGDIVTTGTKTIVTQYTWSQDDGKLVRVKAAAKKKKVAAKRIESEEDLMSDFEQEIESEEERQLEDAE